jgi:hypothetical protein
MLQSNTFHLLVVEALRAHKLLRKLATLRSKLGVSFEHASALPEILLCGYSVLCKVFLECD